MAATTTFGMPVVAWGMATRNRGLCETYVREMFPLYMHYYGRHEVKSEKLAAKRAIESYVERNDVDKADCEAAAKAAMVALGLSGKDIPGPSRIGKGNSTYLGKNAHLRARAEEQGRPYRPVRR